jgi:hypothetical protein
MRRVKNSEERRILQGGVSGDDEKKGQVLQYNISGTSYKMW